MGHRITRAAPHLSMDEVKQRMKTERRAWVRQHWWIIYTALVAPRKADEIALHTGVSAFASSQGQPSRTGRVSKKNFKQAVQAALETREPSDERPVLLMAEDEGCFGRLSIPRRAWAPPGIRPHAPRQVVREYTYVYAAVAPAEGKMTSLILPSADTEMMNLFLEHVSSTYATYFVVMQVDQASWHGTKDLRIPDNIRLIAQPAYS